MREDRFEHLMQMRIRNLNHQLQQQRYISKQLTNALHELAHWDAVANEWRLRLSIDTDVTNIVGHLLSND